MCKFLYKLVTLTTISSCLERYKFDITAIQEVRWEDSGSITSQEMTIVYSGGTKYERGVGLIEREINLC